MQTHQRLSPQVKEQILQSIRKLFEHERQNAELAETLTTNLLYSDVEIQQLIKKEHDGLLVEMHTLRRLRHEVDRGLMARFNKYKKIRRENKLTEQLITNMYGDTHNAKNECRGSVLVDNISGANN